MTWCAGESLRCLTRHPYCVHSSSAAPFWPLELWLERLWRSTVASLKESSHLAGSGKNNMILKQNPTHKFVPSFKPGGDLITAAIPRTPHAFHSITAYALAHISLIFLRELANRLTSACVFNPSYTASHQPSQGKNVLELRSAIRLGRAVFEY